MAKVPRHRIAQAVAKASLEQPDNKRLPKEIAAYLLEEHRTNELDSLLRDVQQAWANSGFVDVIARVARPLKEEAKPMLAAPFKKLYPAASQIQVTPLLDQGVIGGASLELAEQRLDLSLANRLRKFKQAINVKGN